MSGISRKLRMAGNRLALPEAGFYLLRTITGQSNAWDQFTDDISAYARASNARLVFEYENGRSALSFYGDLQLDAVSFDGSFYSFENAGHSWLTSAAGETTYEAVSWTALSSGTTARKWNVDAGGTPSSSTGRTDAAEGTYYVYAETSSPATQGTKFWLRSPTTTLSASPTLSYYVARYGVNIGTLRIYLEVL